MATVGAGLALAENGVYVLPVGKDKRPLGRLAPHGVHNATVDPDVIRGWFGRVPDVQLAAACGGPAHLFVVDCDRHKADVDGVANYAALGLPDVGEPVSQTGGGGVHRWYLAPAPVANSVGLLAPGVDVRGAGGYVLTPDSVSDSGAYTWLRQLTRGGLPTAPAALLQRLAPSAQTPSGASASQAFGLSVDGALNRLRGAVEGTRNDSLNLTAFLFGRLVAAGKLNMATADALLTETGLALGLTPGEVKATIKSGLTDGINARGVMPLAEHRITALSALQWAAGTSWPGRGGVSEYRTFMAHAMIALQAGRDSYNADVRTLGELANTSHVTAWKATRRLIDAGVLQCAGIGGRVLSEGVLGAATYRFSDKFCLKLTYVQEGQTTANETETNEKMSDGGATVGTGPCVPGSAVVDMDVCKLWAEKKHTHDAFSWGGLGAVAAQVYEMLRSGPLSVADLHARTGRGERSIYRALSRMARLVDTVTGEVFPPLVTQAGKLWTANPADLDALAVFLHVDGRQARRKAQHARERETFARLCSENETKRRLRQPR